MSLNFTLNPDSFGKTYEVRVLVEGDFPYVYQLDDGMNTPSGNFQNILPGTHRLTISTEDGCQVLIREFQIFGYPPFFTPNGDGINDRWNLLGTEGLEVNSVSIFDRFGRLLHVMEGSGPGWDGTSNGRQVPASSYWFRVAYESEGRLLSSTGYFALKR